MNPLYAISLSGFICEYPLSYRVCLVTDLKVARYDLANALLEVRPRRPKDEDRVRTEDNFLPLSLEFQRERNWIVLVHVSTTIPGSGVHGWSACLRHLDGTSRGVCALRQPVLEQLILAVHLLRERVERWRFLY